MFSNALKLPVTQEQGIRPRLTLVPSPPRKEVAQPIAGITCEMYPNTKRADYRRHATHSLETRVQVAEEAADHAMAYFHATHVPGTGRVPTQTETARLERLADYILAEDHAQGYSILRDPYDMAREEDVYTPPGEGAVEFMRKHDVRIYCEADAEEIAEKMGVKLCRTCGYPFEDTSRAKTKRDCGESCRAVYQKMWVRRKRFGTEELEGERNRLKLDYPFYNPREMVDIAQRSERPHGDYAKIERMVAAKQRKEINGTKVTVKLVDKRGTKRNGRLDGVYGWVSSRRVHETKPSEWSGPVCTYNLNDTPAADNVIQFPEELDTVDISA